MKNIKILSLFAIALVAVLGVMVGYVKAQVTTSDATVTVTGSPTLELAYDSKQKESLLTSTFNVSVNGGTRGINIYKIGGGATFVDQNGTVTRANSVSSATLTPVNSVPVIVGSDDKSQTFFVVPAGQTVNFSAVVTANPQELFAGTYTASLVAIWANTTSVITNSFNLQISNKNQTNSKTIIGEVSPYISSVTPNPISSGQKMLLYGQRLSSAMGRGNLYIDNLAITAPVDGSRDGTTLFFTPPTLTDGYHSLYVRDNVNGTGASNNVSFQVQSASSCYIFNVNLQIGSRGVDVVALQTFLIGKGFTISDLNFGGARDKGYFGRGTYEALKLYQDSVGLPATGFMGPLTRAKVNGDCATTSPSITVLSPNGGENLVKGQNTRITWKGGIYPVQVGIVRSTFSSDRTVVGWINLKANENGYLGWDTNNIGPLDYETTGQSWQIKPGNYKVLVVSKGIGGNYCFSDNSECTYDVSDNYFTITSSTFPNPRPVITVISPQYGPIGTTIELKGTNLAGFEGDLDAVIENDRGENAFLPGIGSVPRNDQTIRVKIESQLCKSNNSYSGLPCQSYMAITPGTYKIYTAPWGNMSNKVPFTVVPTTQSSFTVSSPTQGGVYDNDASQNIIVGWQPYTGDFESYRVYIGNTISNTEILISSDPVNKNSNGFSFTKAQLKEFWANLYGKTTEQIKNAYYVRVTAVKRDSVSEYIVASGKSGIFTITPIATPVTLSQDCSVSNVYPTNPSATPSRFNIDFGKWLPNTSNKTGVAIVGSAGDYWNVVGVPWCDSHNKMGLKNADGTNSQIVVGMQNLGGSWGDGQMLGIQDPMLADFSYPAGNKGGNAYVTLSNVPGGTYDLYLYNKTRNDGQNGDYTVRASDMEYGHKAMTTDTDSHLATSWQENNQFVVYKNVRVQSGGIISIMIQPSAGGLHDAQIAGLQLAPVPTPTVQYTLYQGGTPVTPQPPCISPGVWNGTVCVPSVTPNSIPFVQIISPNGGGYYHNDGSVMEVNWYTSKVPSTHSFDVIRLRTYPNGQEYNIAYNVQNTGQARIAIPSSIPVGAYTLEMKTYVGDTLVMDASDSYFKIVSTQIIQLPAEMPTAIISVSPNTIAPGGSAVVSWSSSGASSCTVSGLRTTDPTGSQTVKFTVPANVTYTVTCTGSGGTSQPVSANLTVTSLPSTQVSAPIATFTVEGQHRYMYTPGQTNHIKWSSANADTFSSSYTATGGTVCGGGPWVANTASGESNSYMSNVYAGCVWTITYIARNSNTGQSASDTIVVSLAQPVSAPVVQPATTPKNQQNNTIQSTNLTSTIWDAVKEYLKTNSTY